MRWGRKLRRSQLNAARGSLNAGKYSSARAFVGPPVGVYSEVMRQETRDILTPCKVMRCRQLEWNIHLLAMQILE